MSRQRRRAPNMSEKLDAALLEILRLTGQPIERAVAKEMEVGGVDSLFDWDHDPIKYSNGGTTHPSNLTPRLRNAHREKTATRDLPEMAKGKRVARAHEFHRLVMLMKAGTADEDVDAPEKRTSSKWRKPTAEQRASMKAAKKQSAANWLAAQLTRGASTMPRNSFSRPRNGGKP